MSKNTIVLGLLQSLKETVNGGSIPGFEFRPNFGICWHMYMNHKSIGFDVLSEAFEYYGYDPDYPVEVLEGYTPEQARRIYSNHMGTRYDANTSMGRNRLLILDKLIEYFATLVKMDLEKI